MTETRQRQGHRCPGPECKTDVPRSKLMCPRHWGQVPRPIQQEVYAAYDHGRGALSDRHMAAIQAAIDSITP